MLLIIKETTDFDTVSRFYYAWQPLFESIEILAHLSMVYD